MKIPIVSALLSLLLASFLPAADLIVNPETLSPSSTLEVRFDTPMVDKDRVGTVEKTSPLMAEPAITGEFKWTSTRSGQFRFTQPPALGETYQFSLTAGLKDATGATLPKTELGEFSAEAFQISDTSREYSYSYGNSSQRVGRFILQFNDVVNPEDVAKSFQFSTQNGSQVVPAKARFATGKDFKGQYNPTISPTWEELAAGIKPAFKGDEPRQNAIVVETAQPLPVGADWQLALAKPLKNRNGDHEIAEMEAQNWGTVLALNTTSIVAETHFDHPHEVVITFNKLMLNDTIEAAKAAEKIASFIKVQPVVEDLKVEVSGPSVHIKGRFVLGIEYNLEIQAGLPGADELGLEASLRENVIFHPSHAYVSTSAITSSQMSQGNGLFDIYSANYKNLRVRVKQLSDAELIKARTFYQSTYNPWGGQPADIQKAKDTPFESYPGTAIFEKTFTNDKELEKSTLHQIAWKDVLGQTPAAPLFIEIEATAQDGAPAGTTVNRSIVEFTDIGVFLKNTGKDSLVYAFSLKTGAPLANVQLNVTDKDGNSLRTAQTDAQGLSSVASEDANWILAKNGGDCTAIQITGDSAVSLYRQNINTAWESPWTPRFETLIFSDRPIYKPGDTAHVKAITRIRSGDAFSVSGAPITANVVLTDGRNRTILSKKITFSANGTWNDEITFPEGNVGWYGLQIKFLKDGKPADEENSDSGEIAYHDFRVDDYKANTFEVALQGEKFKVTPDRVTLPLKANYYMGKALSSAKVSWTASLSESYSPPAAYSEYHFGDADSWWHYGKNRDDETATEEENLAEWGANGELTLNEDGTTQIDLPLPPLHKEALPQTINVYADVTDVNQQTISSSTEFQIPGADFLIGTRKASWYATAGKEFGFEFIAITAAGKPFTSPVPVDVKIEYQEWNTVRVQGAGDAITTKNQSTLIEKFHSSVQLSSTNGQASLGELTFTPKQSGTYFLTATTKDARGTTILSRVPFYVLGAGGYPWSWEDGGRITLQPDKTSVKPGEEVSIVVKSPISGKALVTVERNNIHRQFVTDISPENPVVKVKLTDEDAPNAFISVVVIRGAKDSPQPDALPEYKVGYCEIQVPSDTKKLFVNVKPSQDTVRPAEEMTVTATVTDFHQKAVENAEVTLYAVDEGVLSLMEYKTPSPFEHFYASMPLAVKNYTTIDSLIKESLDKRHRGNKGITIGGGGDDASADSALRKNFVATALWSATLQTDKDGRVTANVKVPDSLTRYRIMAIAAKDADKFGNGESLFVVNKSLMVEPVVPRFAHVGDELLIKAVVHNTTTQSGEVEVELKLDDKAILITESRPFALISAKNRTMTNDGKSDRRVISLKAGETAALSFPIRIIKKGTVAWNWSVRTKQWPDKELADSVESKFEVTSPAPALREVHYFDLTSATTQENLLKKVNPQLLESEGTLRLNLSQSRLAEARDALEYLLQYPYGCVEQTTSRMLPWLTLGEKYEPLFPDLLQKDKVIKAIKRGTDQLLLMQTQDGGLAYWPGSEKGELWASAYGGFALFKAKDWGISIPQESLDKLTGWISTQLRELDIAKTNDTQKLNDAALAVYTLARAGKAEPAYETQLYTRRDRLPETSRLFLALAMCVNKAPEKQIAELIKPAKKGKQTWDRFWLGENTADGLRLIVNAHLGQTTDANVTATELLKRRNVQGHWGTTFSNAWILLGLTTNEIPSKNPQPLDLQLTWGDKASNITLPSPLSSASGNFEINSNLGAKPLQVNVPANQTVRGRLEVKAWPDLKTFQPVVKGFGIKRKYERLTPVGSLEPAKDLRVGDLVVVTLEIDVKKPNRYLALEDPLPSVFEPINPEFTTQNKREDAAELDNEWLCDYRELRNDKALFFTDEANQTGKFELKYLVRVIAEGDVIAPPSRIEAMYQPDQYGLGNIDRIQTLPMGNNGNVVGQ